MCNGNCEERILEEEECPERPGVKWLIRKMRQTEGNMRPLSPGHESISKRPQRKGC